MTRDAAERPTGQEHGAGSTLLPSRVRVNAIANYVGRGWATVVGLVCLPLFLALLGREAYGLIGAFAVLQAWALLLDFGLTPTLNREIVRARAGIRSWASLADLVRSVEAVIAVVAGMMAVLVVVLSPFLATEWLRPQELPLRTVEQALSIMGLLAALRWIEQVYRGAIQGSEDQVWLNVAQSVVETSRWVGALLLIRFVEANVMLFFVWNLVVSACSILVIRARVVHLLGRHAKERGRVRLQELGAVRGFAGGMFLSSVLTFLLTQSDKLVVGNVLPLADFGLYTLAGTAAAGLLQLVQPMTVAVLPRLTALVEAERWGELAGAFHRASQWLSAIILPIGLTVVVLPEHALLGWTGDLAVAQAAAPVLSLLMLASVLSATMNMPYLLQLAHGWTSLTNKVNALTVLIMLPALVWATRTYGGSGAAATVAAVHLLWLVVTVSLIMRRFLPSEALRWYGRAVLIPAVAGGGVAAGLRMVLGPQTSRIAALAELALVGGIVGLVAVLLLPAPRQMALRLIRLRRP